jgi:hypothetical protein
VFLDAVYGAVDDIIEVKSVNQIRENISSMTKQQQPEANDNLRKT